MSAELNRERDGVLVPRRLPDRAHRARLRMVRSGALMASARGADETACGPSHLVDWQLSLFLPRPRVRLRRSRREHGHQRSKHEDRLSPEGFGASGSSIQPHSACPSGTRSGRRLRPSPNGHPPYLARTGDLQRLAAGRGNRAGDIPGWLPDRLPPTRVDVLLSTALAYTSASAVHQVDTDPRDHSDHRGRPPRPPAPHPRRRAGRRSAADPGHHAAQRAAASRRLLRVAARHVRVCDLMIGRRADVRAVVSLAQLQDTRIRRSRPDL